jgi:hypothetical protein
MNQPPRWEPADRNIRYFIYTQENEPYHDAVIEAPNMVYAAAAWFQGHAADICWVRHTNYDTHWPHTRAYAIRTCPELFGAPPFHRGNTDAL